MASCGFKASFVTLPCGVVRLQSLVRDLVRDLVVWLGAQAAGAAAELQVVRDEARLLRSELGRAAAGAQGTAATVALLAQQLASLRLLCLALVGCVLQQALSGWAAGLVSGRSTGGLVSGAAGATCGLLLAVAVAGLAAWTVAAAPQAAQQDGGDDEVPGAPRVLWSWREAPPVVAPAAALSPMRVRSRKASVDGAAVPMEPGAWSSEEERLGPLAEAAKAASGGLSRLQRAGMASASVEQGEAAAGPAEARGAGREASLRAPQSSA